jgi:organic hydroperoxide reductase OsmC/OhrA
MKISAKIDNSYRKHKVTLITNDSVHSIEIPSGAGGLGSSANGGELLFLALATCYCNDIYREAAERGIEVKNVEVKVEGDFGGEGEPAQNIIYNAKIAANAGEEEILDLMKYVDTVAEIQNTLREKNKVILKSIEVLKDNK